MFCTPRSVLVVLGVAAATAACALAREAEDDVAERPPVERPDRDDALASDAMEIEPLTRALAADGPDVPPAAFPRTSPPVFGYTLVDAFPGTFLSGAMDMEWPAGSREPFVLQRGGHIVRLHGNGARTLVLNFEHKVVMRGEAGALGMALHPKFADPVQPKPYAYIWYYGTPNRQRLSRFTWNASARVFDAASELVMFDQPDQTTEHNGARVRFGPDGFLYFGNGDDTREGATTQRLDAGLFSGLFRIDVDARGGAVSHPPPRRPPNATTSGYYIPNDNPFVGVPGALEEYYALGFRNPYGFGFDRATGALWLGDVGDTFREEIDRVTPGGNYRWPYFEGWVRVRDGETTLGAARTPVFNYTHASIADLTAIVMGYVYRGSAMPELNGKLVFSDWPTGRVWALDTATTRRSSLVETNWQNPPVSFAQDRDGEIYLIGWSRFLTLARAPATAVPTKLSATGIFRNLETLKTPSTVVPYSIRSPLWSDGATKQRWVYVPNGQRGTMTASGTVNLPVGSLLVKHFELPPNAQPTSRTRRLETRVLVVAQDTTYGLTYRWNSAGSDADLVTEAIDEVIGDVNPAEARTWHYPSIGECWSCHRPENRVLGFRGEQLNFPLSNGANQLTALANRGVLDGGSVGATPPPLASPTDTTASIDARASAYLAANCSPCHHPGASYLGGTTWNAMPNVPAASRGLLGQPHHNLPMATWLGMPNAPLVAPGNPGGSILRQRMRATNEDLRMPPVGRTRVDGVGLGVIDAWIASLAP